MSIEEFKREIKTLSEDERHELASFLTELELDEDPGYWARIRSRVSDEEKSRWISAKDLDAG